MERPFTHSSWVKKKVKNIPSKTVKTSSKQIHDHPLCNLLMLMIPRVCLWIGFGFSLLDVPPLAFQEFQHVLENSFSCAHDL